MTNPPLSNEGLVALATDQELEGEDTTQIVQAVSDRFGQISAELQTAQDALAATGMDNATRTKIVTSLTNAKTLSDNSQQVLQALLAAPPA